MAAKGNNNGMAAIAPPAQERLRRRYTWVAGPIVCVCSQPFRVPLRARLLRRDPLTWQRPSAW